jgi:phosphate transport system substrate-binding protein
MSLKNETTILVLTVLVSVSLAGGLIWGLIRGFGTPFEENNVTAGGSAEAPTTPYRFNPQARFDSFAQIPDLPSGLATYGGSTSWAPIRGTVDPVIQMVLPQFKLRYTQHPTQPPGSGTGIEMILNNQLVFAQSSRGIKEEEQQQAKERGFSLKAIPIALDGIAVAVNPDLNIPGLTLSQLKDIYTGVIWNWSQVGGPDLEIIPYSRRPENSGTIEFFIDNVMGGEPFGRNVEFMPTTTLALRAVASRLGGIYYASAPEIVGQCSVTPLAIAGRSNRLIPPYREPFIPAQDCPNRRNQLNEAAFQNGEYPLTRRLFVIVKENGQIDQQLAEAYAALLLTEQGQGLIEQAGFVRIR